MRVSDINYPSQATISLRLFTKQRHEYHSGARFSLFLHQSAKMPVWEVIRYPPSGLHNKSLSVNICCHSLPQDPQRVGAHVRPDGVSHRPEPFIWRLHHRNQWSPRLQLAWSCCQVVNVIWVIWQDFGSCSQETTFGCKSSEWLKLQWREITPEPKVFFS